MEIKLTGWNALIVGALVLGFAFFRFSAQSAELETQGVKQIKTWLISESMRTALPDMEKAMQDPEADESYLSETAENLQEDNLKIISVKRHGSGSQIIARVETSLNDQSPDIRYLKMKYSMATGWVVVREASKWEYYLALFGGPKSS